MNDSPKDDGEQKAESKDPYLSLEDIKEVRSDAHPVPTTPAIKQRSVSPLGKFIGAVLGVVLLALIVFGVGLYSFQWSGKYVTEVLKILPYPLAMVESKPIIYQQYRQDLEALQFYVAKQKEQAGDNAAVGIPSDTELRTLVLDRLVENAELEALSKRYDLTVADSDVETEYQRLYGTEGVGTQEELEKNIKEFYNWTPEEFKAHVIKPYLLNQKVSAYFYDSNDLFADEKARAEEVLALVKKGDKSFEDLAKEYSGDSSAQSGGSLGYFGRGVMVKAFEDVAFTLDVGAVSDIVKTEFGYHIIKLEDRTTAPPDDALTFGEEGEETISARHILIKTQTYEEWFVQEKESLRVYKLVTTEQLL